MTYQKMEQTRAAAWKSTSPTLPEAARAAGTYTHQDGAAHGPFAYCLPAAYAGHNLLPEIRDDALQLFRELEIPWHCSIRGGPSNHLLSSQVQCANALTAMVHEPRRIHAAFADVLGTEEVLEVEPGRVLTFEYIGPTDFFGEVPGGTRIRGAHCTSVDAAFRHRTHDGLTELVLLEWKYTETYRRREPNPRRDAERRRRYEAAVDDPAGPIRGGVFPFELLLDEPLYQLVRQQLLAYALERAGVADRVRVAHVLSPANAAYQRSVYRPEQLALGRTVSEIWTALLRHPDRFVTLNPALFLDETVTSPEYVRRYGDLDDPA